MKKVRAILLLALDKLVYFTVFTGLLCHFTPILGADQTLVSADDAILTDGDFRLHLELCFVDEALLARVPAAQL